MSQENSVRKSALMYHYGIGGLWTNNSDETFIIKAPKFWNWEGGSRGMITEENLRKHLGVNAILFPPGAKDKQIELVNGDVALGRFPGWHRCKGWRTLESGKKQPCGAMVQLLQKDLLPLCTHRNCSGRNSKKSTYAPIRFMQVCSEGHLDDFPFQEWVHNDDSSVGHSLRYITTSGSGLSGIIIKCETCSSKESNVQKSMRGALTPDNFSKKEIKCKGRKPWLNDDLEDCDCETLTGVQKSSSNLLFPIVRNSIYCPSEDTLPAWIKEWVDSNERRSQFIKLLPSFQNSNSPLLDVVKIFASSLNENKKEELYTRIDEVNEYLIPTSTEDPFEKNEYQGIYQREYDRFLNYPENQKLDDFTISRPSIGAYDKSFSDKIKSVGLLEKLRDTRVYAGFSRINPSNRPLNESIQSCYGVNEVVGDIVRGEGIFIQFSTEAINAWLKNEEANQRHDILTENKKEELLSKTLINNKEQAITYMLLHSISHALISEISIFSGYNTASIKERIYVGSDGKNSEMNGILVYTSDGDSEGSLGGLVRLGKPGVFESILNQAIKRATWCSSDPLCSHSIPKGINGSNLAACHHCLLLPETSCESRNEFLDRGLIINENNPKLGFFN